VSEAILAVLPFAVGSAFVPVHILITVLLLRGPGGRAAAAAWIAGMTSTRLVQGVVFGLILAPVEADATEEESRLILAIVLLVVAVAMLAMAARAIAVEPDEDAPPPAWMSALEGVRAGRAYALGAGTVAIGAKFWAFTLGAIAALGEAKPGIGPAIVAFLVFVLVAASIQLALLVVALMWPARADALTERLSGGLTSYGRPIKVVVGVVFGLWFLVAALDGLGVL
jgi:hypothetical protein